jgi:hypothetical protein
VSQAAGEIYFIGEKDLRTKELTQYFKVGIVRENSNNQSRDSTDRLSEHQIGNPRELYIESVVQTELVESVETLLHKQFAPLGVRGEWMMLLQGRWVLANIMMTGLGGGMKTTTIASLQLALLQLS